MADAFWSSQELAGAGGVGDVREMNIPGPVWFLAYALSKMGAFAGLRAEQGQNVGTEDGPDLGGFTECDTAGQSPEEGAGALECPVPIQLDV